jgi:hypothetical protein
MADASSSCDAGAADVIESPGDAAQSASGMADDATLADVEALLEARDDLASELADAEADASCGCLQHVISWQDSDGGISTLSGCASYAHQTDTEWCTAQINCQAGAVNAAVASADVAQALATQAIYETAQRSAVITSVEIDGTRFQLVGVDACAPGDFCEPGAPQGVESLIHELQLVSIQSACSPVTGSDGGAPEDAGPVDAAPENAGPAEAGPADVEPVDAGSAE